jgi:hypothetical protein
VTGQLPVLVKKLKGREDSTKNAGSRAKMKLSDGCSESFDVESGLRQGDALPPMLFNIVLEAVLINIDKRGNISTKM